MFNRDSIIAAVLLTAGLSLLLNDIVPFCLACVIIGLYVGRYGFPFKG